MSPPPLIVSTVPPPREPFVGSIDEMKARVVAVVANRSNVRSMPTRAPDTSGGCVAMRTRLLQRRVDLKDCKAA